MDLKKSRVVKGSMSNSLDSSNTILERGPYKDATVIARVGFVLKARGVAGDSIAIMKK